MADNNDPDRERLAQALRYIRQAVEEILQQSGVPPSTTSMALSARMPPPATPVQPVQSAVQRSTSNGDNRPFQVGSNSGPPESGQRSASQELRDAFAPYSRHAYQFTRFGRVGSATGSRGHGTSRRGRSPYSSVSNNWTHRFCLIPFKDQVYVPTLSEKESWRRAGMGEKTLVYGEPLPPKLHNV